MHKTPLYSRDTNCTYDAAGQRTARSSTNPLGSRDVPHQASYDANNRLTHLTLNPGTAQAKTYTLSYNATGSLISKVNTADASDTSTYSWDSQQRLTQVQTPEHTASYRYDLLGRRVQRQITKPGQPTETTHYVYDGLQAIGEIRPQQSSTSFLTGLNLDEMLARVTTFNGNTPNTTQPRTYLTDALGSVMAQTQDNQSTLAGYSYSPYGHTQSTGNTEGDSVQYTAREHDANGLYYYRARYYDPVLKRFISEDPIGLQGGSLSFYAYVNGDPVSLTDPLGLMGNGTARTLQRHVPQPGRGVTDWGGPATGSGSRSLLDGARYGWWGGKNWSGGPDGTRAPIDSSDACYMQHDKCYDTCKGLPAPQLPPGYAQYSPYKACMRTCDKYLIQDLNGLPSDPRNWPSPPPLGMEDAANRMRDAARVYFQ